MIRLRLCLKTFHKIMLFTLVTHYSIHINIYLGMDSVEMQHPLPLPAALSS